MRAHVEARPVLHGDDLRRVEGAGADPVAGRAPTTEPRRTGRVAPANMAADHGLAKARVAVHGRGAGAAPTRATMRHISIERLTHDLSPYGSRTPLIQRGSMVRLPLDELLAERSRVDPTSRSCPRTSMPMSLLEAVLAEECTLIA